MTSFLDANINMKIKIINVEPIIIQCKIYYKVKILKFQKNGVIHH